MMITSVCPGKPELVVDEQGISTLPGSLFLQMVKKVDCGLACRHAVPHRAFQRSFVVSAWSEHTYVICLPARIALCCTEDAAENTLILALIGLCNPTKARACTTVKGQRLTVSRSLLPGN